MKTRSELWQFLWRQRGVPLQHKKLIYKKLLSAGESPDAPFEKDFFGLCYRGNLSNSIEFNIYYYGAFEKPLLFFLRDTLLKLQDAGGNEAGADAGEGQVPQLHRSRHFPIILPANISH